MRITLVLVLSLGLTACGFTPMYGSRGVTTSGTVVASLAQVDIRPIAERRGMVLRQQLDEKLHPGGVKTTRYDLQVRLASSTQELGVPMSFRLLRGSTGKILHIGRLADLTVT